MLVGKTILITGAAGRIGTAVAAEIVEAGGSVILADIASERLEKIKLLFNNPLRVHAITADVTSAEGIDSLISMAASIVDRIDGAVHSAYPTSPGWGTPFGGISQVHLNQDLAWQLGGAILFSQQILAYFSHHGGGDLIHISSIQGIRAPKFEHYEGTSMTSPVEYAAIKAGVIAITGWLAKFHRNQGIRVNCISPGGILDSQPEIFVDRYRASCTNIGMLSAKHIGAAVHFLLSPAAKAINGQNLVVDDGWSL